MIKTFLTILALAVTLATMFLFGIDREIARQDYLDGKLVKGCLFEINCDYYNNLEE